MLTRRHRLAVLTASAVLLLTGCSSVEIAAPAAEETTVAATPSPESDAEETSGQTKEEACAIVEATMTEFAELSGSLDMNDPQGVVDSFAELSATSSEALGGITNDEVKDGAAAAATALADYAAFIEQMMADPTKVSEMTDQITALQESFTAVGTTCIG